MSIKSASLNRLLKILRGSPPLLVLLCSCFLTDARAQVSPETQAQIAAYIEQSRALAAAYDARPRPDPYADLRARSARLTADQRAQAQALFNSAFSLWQNEQFSAAEAGFRQGLDIDPANGVANFYLGDIMQRRNVNDEAAIYMAAAVAFAPSSAEGLRAQVALRQMPDPEPAILRPSQIFAPSAAQISFNSCQGCPQMVTIPAGEFTMGSPPGRSSLARPRRRISIRAFAVSKFEITFAEWDGCTASGGCAGLRPADEGAGRGAQPVINVSWNDAQHFVAWLNQRAGRFHYRLLTEAEWEYAARAGSNSDWSWGGDLSDACQHENLSDLSEFMLLPPILRTAPDISCDDGVGGRAAPVGHYFANAFGLFDMHGNVSEWTEDCLTDNLSGLARDGSAQVSQPCLYRVQRGGNWYTNPRNTTSWSRAWERPASRSSWTGLRIAATLEG
jgi:formylglycine-generating enzyme required for sulfatase activity